MRCRLFALALGACCAGSAVAQPPAPPEVLPPTVLEPVLTKPLAAADAAKQREQAIADLKEELISFDGNSVVARQVAGRWQVRTEKVVLKDFGSDRESAMQAAQLIAGLHVNQMGTVPGSSPAFEYWLSDGKPPRMLNSRALIVPVAGRSLHAEQVGGTWVVTDGAKGLYDFGNDRDAARRAAIICWKYGFNQLGVVGEKRATMLCPLTDPRQADREKSAPVMVASALSVLNDVSKTSLLLPGNVYAGPKTPIDAYKLEVKRLERGGDMVLVSGKSTLGTFGANEQAARSAMRALQDANVNEIARIGTVGIPLFFVNGAVMHGEPLGSTKQAMRPDRLKVQKIRDTFWVCEESRPLIEAGSRDDAELLANVIRHFDLKSICTYGHAETGGLRMLTTGR